MLYPRSFLFLEVDTCTIDAISDSRLVLWSVVKKMSQMAVTLAASNLSSDHSVCVVHLLGNVCFLNLIVKCRPSASAIKLHLRSKQRLAADNTVKDSFLLGVVVFICITLIVLLKGGSVPFSWVTLYCIGVSLFLSSYFGYLDMFLFWEKKLLMKFIIKIDQNLYALSENKRQL